MENVPDRVFSEKFPVLKLPDLASHVFIKLMEPTESLDLSLLSKRSRLAVRRAFTKNEIRLRSCFTDDPEIIFKSKTIIPLCLEISHEHLHKRNHFLNIDEKMNEENEENADNTEWLSFDSMKIWTDYLCKTFNCNIHHLCIHLDFCKGKLLDLLRWLNLQKLSIEKCEIGGTFSDESEILSAFSLFCPINLWLSPNADSKIKTLNYTFNVDRLSVASKNDLTDWIKMDNLLNFDCEIIILQYCAYTEEDLNRFLKAWINGSHSRLKIFHATVKLMDREKLFEGIEVEERDRSVLRTYTGDITFDFEGGSDIRRNSGDVATFKQNDYIDSEGWACIRMVVWN